MTGARPATGRACALALVAEGPLVVNDPGGSRVETSSGAGTAKAVVELEEITAADGAAVATDDAASWDAGGHRAVRPRPASGSSPRIEAFGGLDVRVNHAGIRQGRMLANMSETERDEVITVHLKGTFAPSHHAAACWRDRAKTGVDGRSTSARTSSRDGTTASSSNRSPVNTTAK